jgi:hypothetical protein
VPDGYKKGNKWAVLVTNSGQGRIPYKIPKPFNNQQHAKSDMPAKRSDEAYHPKGQELRLEVLGYTIHQSKDVTIEPSMQGKYAYADKYLSNKPKTVTQSMMRTDTYT